MISFIVLQYNSKNLKSDVVKKCIYSDNNIVIEYPELSRNAFDDEKINIMIKEFLFDSLRLKEFLLNENINDEHSFLKSSYEICLLSDDFLSFAVTGDYNISTSAHPSSFFYTLNIDLSECKFVKYTDIYSDNIETIKKYAEKQLDDNIFEYIFNNDKIDINEYMSSIDLPKNEICYSAYTEDSCIISFGVPHVLGDHAEVVIPLSELCEISN